MTYSFTTLYIKDMEKSLAFYHNLLGLDILRRSPIENGGELAFLGKEGDANIELISSPDHAGNTYTGFSIGITVDSLEEASRILAEGGHPVNRGPISPSPNLAFSYVQDPDGIEIQLTAHK